MKQEAKDRGLKKALGSKNSALPSNFTFCTMRKVEEYIRTREKRAEKQMFYSIVAVSAALSAVLGIIVDHFYGKELKRMFSSIADTFLQLDIFATPYILFAIILILLILFDHWMRSSYYKRHTKDSK